MSIYNIFLLLGGLGLFLYGMKIMSDGLENLAGDKLRNILAALTNNRFSGILVGAGVTAVIQSSSATTVMVVGFVNAAMMTLTQAAGVIMGANIGTTMTSQLIAFKLTDAAPIILFIGVVLYMFPKKRSIQLLGSITAGFGMLFLGMNLMTQAMEPLRYMESFKALLITFSNPLLGVLIGALVTAVIQSSSASVGILQAFALQGLIGFNSAVYIILGQNIGTCVTALLACIGTSKTAKRAAVIHLLFNVLGTIIFLVALTFIPIIPFIQSFSGTETVRQIANFHTIFNVSVTILLFPLVNQLVSLATIIVPGKDPEVPRTELVYLNDTIFSTPPLAVSQLSKEVHRMSELAVNNLDMVLASFFNKELYDKPMLERAEKTLNFLNYEITRYLVEIQARIKLSTKDSKYVGRLFHVVADLERIGDHSENIFEYIEYLVEKNAKVSEDAVAELKHMGEKTQELVNLAIEVFEKNDTQLLKQIEPAEQYIDDLQIIYRDKHVERLNTRTCNPEFGVVFTDMIGDLERIADHATNIAYSILDNKAIQIETKES